MWWPSKYHCDLNSVNVVISITFNFNHLSVLAVFAHFFLQSDALSYQFCPVSKMIEELSSKAITR